VPGFFAWGGSPRMDAAVKVLLTIPADPVRPGSPRCGNRRPQPPWRDPRIRMTTGMTSGCTARGAARRKASARPGRLALLGAAVYGMALCGFPCGPISAARAEEPLYLRIRANPDARLAGTSTSGTAASGPAAAATARESVWERSDRRARIAIASVCTGCLPARSDPIAVRPSPVAEAATADMPSPLSSPSPSPFAPTAGDP